MSIKSGTWVLIADGSRARLFATEGPGGALRPALGKELIGTNLPSRDLASDRPGRTFDSGGEGRHAMERPTDPKRHAKWSFAHDIADILESERKKNAFEALVVVAAPEVLGDLRSEFGADLRRMVTAEIDKDLTKVPTRDLSDHLEKLMRS